MFRFNFDVDEDEPVAQEFGTRSADSNITPVRNTSQGVKEVTSKEVSIEELLTALPHTFSFSPFSIPLASKRTVVIARRDLFDARFQLIASDQDANTAENGQSDLDFLDAPSDLVPGVYEGGLKTWECSLDLVDCLDGIYGEDVARRLKGKRVVELGCGTAIPSLYLLHSVFAGEPSSENGVRIHLQDYNELVLRLVTLPNVILAWYMSPASAAFRSPSAAAPSGGANEEDEPEPLPPADATEPGELPITDALKSAFLDSLRQYGVHLKFFTGSWASFDVAKAGGPYDIVLTSETIYRTDSLGSLVDLLHRATARVPASKTLGASLAERTAQLSLTEGGVDLRKLADEPYLCLVAAKLVYFGVGGGVNEFVRAVEGGEEKKGEVRTVWERIHGVKRSVMQVTWNAT
ncbi:hypothetical protein C8Q77DRAFT_1277650 [Trametes polyzona]|nr:hypothetical protein C8Q77DRAFT_1277650 [Trametes polyzona]